MKMKILSPLNKVFLDREPAEDERDSAISGFQNETISFQVAYASEQVRYDGQSRLGAVGAPYVRLEIEGVPRTALRMRVVRQTPVVLPTFPDADENYLCKNPGLYPDLLKELTDCRLRMPYRQWQCIWIDVEPGMLLPGVYPLTLRLISDGGSELCARQMTLTIYTGELPSQALIHTKWFHCDALADYYCVPVFSPRFWEIAENFIRGAVRRGMNMILTPVHTPPLDTEIGAVRKTVQLVDVYLEEGKYRFGFEKFDRWVAMCQSAGIVYYEMAHLFTQWGCACTPQIVATTQQGPKRIFGWDVPADSPEYRAFLDAYLPALTAELERLGIARNCYFHISDDPDPATLAAYLTAKSMVEPYLAGYPIFDALTYVELYQNGAVPKPVASNLSAENFLAAGVENLWIYYCIEQYKTVSNQFIAMPSARNRILGAQMYKYSIEGFLHWGYNYYYARHSAYLINPYTTTDGDASWPAGDPFQVYPGADGRPVESIRLMVTAQAFQDYRALKWLERLAGRDFVLDLIDRDLEEPLRFMRYPKSERYLLDLRERVNQEIALRMA